MAKTKLVELSQMRRHSYKVKGRVLKAEVKVNQLLTVDGESLETKSLGLNVDNFLKEPWFRATESFICRKLGCKYCLIYD